MEQSIPQLSKPLDMIRQGLILLAAPLIWIASSLGVFLDFARSPSDFSDLSENILVPQTFAFSIWFPIFVGVMAFGVLQMFRANRTRAVFRETGWWIAAGLWGIVAWGLATSFLPDTSVELAASLIFIPSMMALVIAMVKMTRRKDALDQIEIWLALVPVSLIAGWCSIAVFVGLNGLIWKWVEPLGWSQIGIALTILSVALGWAIVVLRRGAQNRIYAFPIIWGLGFLALKHFTMDGSIAIGLTAITGIVAILIAAGLKSGVSVRQMRKTSKPV